MELRVAESSTNILQWLKLQLRITALEESGSRLSCRFEFPAQTEQPIICRIYFTDDDSNSIKDVSQEERTEIYHGWVSFAVHVINRALVLAELPPSFVWQAPFQFVLHENHGMGSAVVQRINKSIVLNADSRDDGFQ
jgi:hypothetical protein